MIPFYNRTSANHNLSWQPAVWLLSLLSALFVYVWLAPFTHPFEPLSDYLPIHTAVETLCVVFAILIFAVGWRAYVPSRSMNVVVIACAFLAVALLDLGHFMSYSGMPDFITPGTPSKSITFWLSARFIAAIALLASIVIGWKPVSSALGCYLLATFCIGYTAIAYWLILFHPAWLPETFITGTGLTPFKIIAEYVVVLIHITSAVLLFLFMGNRVSDSEYARNLFIAVTIMALSELCFTLYASVSDIFNLLGHLYKTLAYYFLYKAIYAISIKAPFVALQNSQNLVSMEKEFAQITLNSIGDAIITTDFDGSITLMNPIAEALTGWTQQEAAGMPLDEVLIIVNQVTRKPLSRLACSAIRDNCTIIDDINNHSLLISRDDKEYSIEYSASPMRNSAGYTLGCVLVFHNITEKYQLMEQISWQAGHDTLTHLPNRTLLSDRIGQAIAHAQRQEHLLLVCFMDLDGFKAVNDLHGHDLGDKLLIEVARRLLNVVRSDDTVSRLGGDEFVLLLSEIRTMDEVDILLSRILDEMACPYLIGQQTLKISASIGATIFPFDSSDTDTLLRHADQAMYQAKQSGRNRFHLFDASMDLQAHAHHLQLIRLQQALAQNELLLFYQPKVNLKSNRIIGMEALLRWQHPEKGLLGPRDFLHLAEDSNLIVDIGNWVLDEALRQISAWHAAGHDWIVSVNIAARQLQSHEFFTNIQAVLARHPGAPAHRLELEILESTALEDLEHVRSIILSCQGLGISISLDDFGSGYSSLAYLRLLPVNTLKIDQSFVRDMLDDEEDCALVDGILQLARVFKREVIAEGMETAAHGALLLKLGCNMAQGNGIARPMPAEEVPLWAAQFKPDPRWQNYPAALVGWGLSPAKAAKTQSELTL
jgi:diguanylate cyclase (GGDEF)-like protein/PAS domain S-box-containing protein